MTFARLALACATLYAGAPPAMDAEVAKHLSAIHTPGGSETDLRDRQRAIAWLVANADRSFLPALGAAESTPQDAALIDLLARYRRKEATPVFVRAFALGDPTRRYAAAGLGMSPDPAARAALIALLESKVAAEVEAALAGLEASGDAKECPRIVAHLKSASVEVRWRAVHAGATLGCLKKTELEAIARDDADALVRDVAKEALARR